jgi:plasmid stabilization system protein ParE
MARIVVTAPADADVAAILDHLTANAGRLIAAKYAEAFDAAYGRLD